MTEQFGYRQELKRSLNLFDLVVYGLLVIVTTSPKTTFGIVYNASHGMVPLVYAVGLIAMIFTAFSYVMISRVSARGLRLYLCRSRHRGDRGIPRGLGGVHLCGNRSRGPGDPAARGSEPGAEIVPRTKSPI